LIVKLKLHFKAGAVACLALLAASSALAKEDRWFRVELLVFSHESKQAAEQWEPTPTLAYPGAARFLVEPQRIKNNLAQHHADSVVDEFGRQILTILPKTGTRNLPRVSDNATTDIPLAGGGASSGVGQAAPNTTTTAEGQSALLRPTPFVALPGSQREFRGKAAYMQRSGQYQTLFHQTWVQPVPGQAAALPIVLDRSGDTGQWTRLQGTITLYLSRYLHLETNLWLNTQGEYLAGDWRMPAPPLGPPSLIIEELPVPQNNPTTWGSADQQASTVPGAEIDLTELEVDTGPVYPYRHAILLQQKRRMRSTEVHYIDHPRLGVVVKLTPVTADELETMALAEAGTASD
jgi:hypothetical protein